MVQIIASLDQLKYHDVSVDPTMKQIRLEVGRTTVYLFPAESGTNVCQYFDPVELIEYRVEFDRELVKQFVDCCDVDCVELSIVLALVNQAMPVL